MDLADFYEQASDHLTIQYEAYILTGQCFDKEKLAIIREFVDWCVKDDEESLHAPRRPDSKSFWQRREEKRTENTTIEQGESHGTLG